MMFATFPYGGTLHSQVSDFKSSVILDWAEDPEIGRENIFLLATNGTPTPASRNRCLLVAEQRGIDYLLMIDSDMAPDLPYPDAKKFWESSWAFVKNFQKPCLIGAPYCSAPPEEKVLVSEWQNMQSENPNADFQLRLMGRTHAEMMKGITEVGALPTGLLLIDMRAIKDHPHPRCYYEYKDETESEVKCTEDSTLCRDLGYRGIPLFCNWDAWAGHWKYKCVGKPNGVPEHIIPLWMKARVDELAPYQPKPSDQHRPDHAGGVFHRSGEDRSPDRLLGPAADQVGRNGRHAVS